MLKTTSYLSDTLSMSKIFSVPSVFLFTFFCVLLSAFAPERPEIFDSLQMNLEAESSFAEQKVLSTGEISGTDKIVFFIFPASLKQEVIQGSVFFYPWISHSPITGPARLHTCGSLSPPRPANPVS